MKKFVLVAIGGTGMRVAQSLVALAAAGFLSDKCADDYLLEIRLVDLDIVSGSDKIELEEMIRSVNEAIPYMSVIVNDGATSHWKPKGIDAMKDFATEIGDRSTLNTIVSERDLERTDALVFHALFGGDDREMELRRGCKGKPRIGSLLWAESFDRDWSNATGFWRTIFQNIGVDDELRVMFAGSVFGGTGASGTPTLAQKYVRACRGERVQNFAPYAAHVGLTLMLPYFDIGQDTDVDSGLFSINSKMALKYYETSEVLSEVEFAQFVGDDRRQMDKKNEQGEWKRVRLDRNSNPNEGQNDPSMPAELMAAIGICRFFAGDAPRVNRIAQMVSVPMKWINHDPEKDIPADVAFPIEKFDVFPVTSEITNETRIRSIKDYILRLERFCLMLGSYYRANAALKMRWRYRPEVFRTIWREPKNMKELYESRAEGVGAPIAFTESMFRWLEELDHHGLHALLEIEGDAGRNVPHIQDYVARHAAWGSTALDMRGIPCAKITSQINSVQVDPAAATKYFVSALMECCLEKE
ncbi:MAG: hypothetical protein VB062_01105 [Christensenella sp.]|nr:hypothetical protein [Christensenella sp.]